MLKKIAGKLVSVASLSMAVVGSALAAPPDVTGITAAITDGATAATTVAIAFGVAVWGIKGVKLLRRG